MNRKKQRVARNKQKKQLRHKKREQQRRPLVPATLSRKLLGHLDDVYDLIRRGRYDEAEDALQELDRRGTSRPEVVEALMFLYQKTGDRESCCEAAERMTQLRPQDAEVRLIFAQESMFCGRASVALTNYQEFLQRWPDHPHATKARQAIEILVPETERRIQEWSFPPEHAFQLCCLHEESLALLQRRQYAACVAKCQALLTQAPDFVSARNNLALAQFHSGLAKQAVTTVEETLRMLPENRFAEAMLAKLYFLSERGDDAHRLADQIVENPPTQQDSFVAALEVLAFLARDEEVIRLAEEAADPDWDEQSEGFRLHYLAYAKCRLGDSETAKTLWKKCLKVFPLLNEARENLADLETHKGHAPWGATLAKWVPTGTLENAIDSMPSGNKFVLARYPGIASLIPALLDRGDPPGRELAMRLAIADQSPPMLDALKGFAFGTRGPDALRFKALQFLREEEFIDAGPHRIFCGSAWTEIQMLAAEISGEARPSKSSPRVQALMEDGYHAMRRKDFQTAEAVFSQALSEEPDNCSAAYNLCGVWIQRDGAEGQRRAIPHLEQLHRDHPDYIFAAIALAQFAANAGDFQRARDLLMPCYQRTSLHTSEATALYAAQAQLAVAENDLDAAERAFDMLYRIAEDDDPQVLAVRRCIDRASKKKGLRAFFPW